MIAQRLVNDGGVKKLAQEAGTSLMEVISTESLERLRARCKAARSSYVPKNCLTRLVFHTVELDISFGDLNELHMPEGQTQETNKDLENCKLLAENSKR